MRPSPTTQLRRPRRPFGRSQGFGPCPLAVAGASPWASLARGLEPLRVRPSVGSHALWAWVPETWKKTKKLRTQTFVSKSLDFLGFWGLASRACPLVRPAATPWNWLGTWPFRAPALGATKGATRAHPSPPPGIHRSRSHLGTNPWALWEKEKKRGGPPTHSLLKGSWIDCHLQKRMQDPPPLEGESVD